MQKTIYLTVLGLIAFLGIAWIAPYDGLRKLDNPAFHSGEFLEYRVHYGPITAGIATLEVLNSPMYYNGQECFHVIAKGQSSAAFSIFYEVKDQYETYIDKEGLFSWKFKRKIHEGSFRHYTEVEFDQVNHKAYVQRINRPDEVFTYEVPDNIQDVVSAFYFARTLDYSQAKPGDKYLFQNFIDRQVYDLEVEFLKRERIKVGKYFYDCVKLKPLVQEGGVFEHEGDLFLWISDDENHIPVRVESGLIIGSVQIDLKTAENLKHPFTARKSK